MYIAIDIGGTNVRIAGSDSLDDVKVGVIIRFELVHDFKNDFSKIIQSIAQTSNDSAVEGIGVGTPGTYNPDKKFLISAKNLPEWIGVPFLGMLSKEFDCPVFSENDALVACLGEAEYGKGRDGSFLYVTWGTGIGGAIALRESGLVKVERLDWRKYFWKISEGYGGWGLAKRLNKDVSMLTDDEWDIVINDFIDFLVDLSTEHGVSNIILGGGIANKVWRIMKVKLRTKNILNIEISQFGEDTGLYGALALIKQNI